MYMIDCDVINDMLPLYVENMVSDSTKKIVEEHIQYCEGCGNKLKSMNKEMNIPADMSTTAMLRIKKRIDKKNVQTAIFAGLIVLVMAVLTIIHLNSPISLGYSQNIISVAPNTDGSVSVTLSEEVAGYSIESLKDEDSVYSVTCWNTLWNKFISNNGRRTIKVDANGTNREVEKIYYYSAENNTTGDLLIYSSSSNESKSSSGGMITLPRLVLNYYLFISLVLAIIGILLCAVTKRNDKHTIVVRITLIPVSYLLSSIVVLMGHGDIYNSGYYFSGISILAIMMYLLIHFILFKVVFRNR